MQFSHHLLFTLAFWLFACLFSIGVAHAAPSTVLATKVDCLDNAKISAGPGYEDFSYCLFRNKSGRLRLIGINSKNIVIFDGKMSIDTALGILANPGAVTLHKTLLREAGSDLEKLRVEELKGLKDNDYQSEFTQNALVKLNPGAVGRLIDKSTSFTRLGYRNLAISAHEKLLAAYDEKIKKREGKPLSNDDQWEWFSLRSSYLTNRMNKGDIEEAIAGYQLLAKDARISSEYRINAKVNLAASYAELGRFDASLALINQAWREFDGSDENAIDYKLAGSDRHFAWIKACALHGLGKTEEAAPLISFVLSAPEKPVDQHADVYLTSSIERRLYACMGDVDRMAESIIRGPKTALFGHPASMILQAKLNTTKPRFNAFLIKLRAHPKMKAVATDYLPLPPALTPALNSWQ